MASNKGLGRGFDSLIPTDTFDFDPTAAQDSKVSDLRYVKTLEIHADPDQPRRHFDEKALAELASSVKEHGILQPLVVTADNKGYKIVAGERRYRAALASKLEKVPVIVRTLSDQHRLELSLIENIQRHDLTPIETAAAYAKLRDQFSLSLEEIGQRVGGKAISSISNTLRLLKLPKTAQEALANGKLSEGQARPLIGLDERVIASTLPRIISGEWSVRKIEEFAKSVRGGKVTAKTGQKERSNPYIPEAELLAKKFGAKIDIKSGSKGSGKIVISFKDKKEFERLRKLLS